MVPADATSMRLECVEPRSEALWKASIECRYRNLYLPFGLGREVAISALDEPREREDVMHLVGLLGGEVVGTGRMDLQPAHERGPSAQIRYCAVDERVRGRDVGQALLREFERVAHARGIGRRWMDAREGAVKFYGRMGYRDVGEGPLKFGLIRHRVMEKFLTEP